jgi:hypothetical protein
MTITPIPLQSYKIVFAIEGLPDLQITQATGNTIAAAIMAAGEDARRRWPGRTIRVATIAPIEFRAPSGPNFQPIPDGKG